MHVMKTDSPINWLYHYYRISPKFQRKLNNSDLLAQY